MIFEKICSSSPGGADLREKEADLSQTHLCHPDPTQGLHTSYQVHRTVVKETDSSGEEADLS
jgi:hypothetical protein